MEWQERLQWLARGYRIVTFIEIHCIHGSFRSGLESELEAYPCPVCKLACKAVLLGEGVTRWPELPWELVQSPLGKKTRELLLQTPDELAKPRRNAKRPLLRRGWRPTAKPVVRTLFA